MTSQQWDLYKSEIERLYIHESKTLAEVMSYMAVQYSWHKSKAQYTRKLHGWGLRKRSQQIDHAWISKRVAKRKRNGKESEVFVDGVQIPPAKITKSKYREGYVPMILQHAPSPKSPEGYLVTTPQSPGMYVSWNSSFPWLRFINFLQSPQDQNVSSPPLSLFVDSSRHGNAITKGANFELMQRLSSIIPWTKLQNPPNIHSGSRTSATLSILMPEMEQGQHDILSTNLSTSKSGLRDHLSVSLYLISNNLTSRDPEEFYEEKLERDDKLILKLLKDTGWDDLMHLKVLLSTREPTAESITEKVFASALRSHDFEILENMLRSGMSLNRLVEVVNEDDVFFLTPLQFAAQGKRNGRLINLLVKYGADVDFSIDGNGETALYYAINKRNNPAVRALLLQGATVTWKCARVAAAVKPGEMFKFSLIENNLVEDSLVENSPLEDMINIYLEQGLGTEQDDPDILNPAVEAGNVSMIKLFLARGAKLNGLTSQFYPDGRQALRTTLLGRAVRTGNIDTVRLLTHVSTGTHGLPSPSSYISPLALAAMCGFTDITGVLLSSGADIRAADEEEITLLERAVRKDNPALCQMLIKHGAKIDRRPHDTQKSPSALMIAVQRNYKDQIDLLINSNARMNDFFEVAPDTILAAAVEVGDEQVIKKLMNAGARLIGVRIRKIGNLKTAIFLQEIGILANLLSLSGPKLLAAAISDLDDDLAHFLLQNKADEGHQLMRTDTTSSTQTPLRAAIKLNNTTFIQALLERGAEVTDAVLTDAMEKNIELLPVLLLGFSGKAPTAVAHALLETSIVGLESLREANVDPTGAPRPFKHEWENYYVTILGESVLEIAAWKAKSTHFKYLLEWASAAQITWHPKDVARALTMAIFSGNHDYVVDLMHLDSDLSCDRQTDPSTFEFGEMSDVAYTPLQAAVKAQLVWVVRDLLKRADVNYLGEGPLRRTPLQLAVEIGNMEIFNILIDHGADVNASAAFDGGATALQIAAMHGYIGIAQRLLDLGADVNQKPAKFNGRTALMGAAEHGRIDMLHMLLTGGALVVGEHEGYDYENFYFEALELAESRGHYAAAKLLASFKDSVELSD
ncbi:hypothetical protein N7504_008807 [Penicillium tannophilum]|nr:hypothetical protein N7504_008807 [Penicillium tannophilum]